MLPTTDFPLVPVSSPMLLENVQDSLLEITLRSRVIEKLSVALDVCLFATQYGREACPGMNGDGTAKEVSIGSRHDVNGASAAPHWLS